MTSEGAGLVTSEGGGVRTDSVNEVSAHVEGDSRSLVEDRPIRKGAFRAAG